MTMMTIKCSNNNKTTKTVVMVIKRRISIRIMITVTQNN